MKRILRIMLGVISLIALGGCKSAEPTIGPIGEREHLFSIITLTAGGNVAEGYYEQSVANLSSAGLEWYEIGWVQADEKYPHRDWDELTCIFSLKYAPDVPLPKEVERRVFQFQEGGELIVWYLDRSGGKREPIVGTWSCDTTDGVFQLTYTNNNGERCDMRGFLEIASSRREAVVTFFDAEGCTNYYVWRAEWHS